MHKPTVGMSLEGMPIFGLSVLLTLVLAICELTIPAVLAFVVTAFIGHFFRDPERVVPQEEGVAVSPADGRVCKIGREADPITGEERQVVCVFMNVFNVHVNRAPVAGTVRRLLYIPGKFFNASLDKASKDNERLAMGLEDEDGRQWTVVQIAGLIARRIVCWAEEGDSLARGRRYGLIKFGSRLDVYLPTDYDPSVAVGDNVFAGQTVLARKK
ncbi:phosphatidylserine decarboxylase [Desulfobaculum xiamenense]|uniref:Phosphatidylserine decarboxylase proenzyme n=1 Tax=Desulfobaculum xiamenense TaxID=995050 RepID=A0A846QJP7_9BACT|nr:phosphatidylserine decarboxylase family protein [Desulfobaculum xiamenense]NJB67327.1 phosphatidylserine decarboxylase [Desulfobaculum xiamenense]